MADQPKTRAEFEKEITLKAWKDPTFREALRKDPKGTVQRELQKLKADAKLPDELEVEVLEETQNKIYLVLPPHPAEMTDQELTDETLDAVAGGTVCVVGLVAGAVVWAGAVAQVGEAVQEAAQVQAQVQVHVQLQAVQV